MSITESAPSVELQRDSKHGGLTSNSLKVASFTSKKRDLIENLKHLLNQFDGAEYNEEKARTLRAAYENVFDSSLTSIDRVSGLGALTQNRTKYDFESLYEVFAVCAKNQAVIDRFSLEPRTGGIEYSLHLPFCDGHDVTVEVSAETRNGKIIHHERHNVVFTVAENLKNFFSLFDGTQYNEDKLKRAFEKTFDKSLTSLTFPVGTRPEDMSDPSTRVELDFRETFVQIGAAYRKTQNKLTVNSINPLPDGAMDYEIQGLYMGRVGIIRCHVLTKNGLITRFEREETMFSEIVSGQVVATLDDDVEIAKHVLKLPTQAGGRLLCGGSSEILPCSTKGEVIKLFLEHKRSVLFPMSSTTKITLAETKEAYADGASLYGYRRPMNQTQCFVLREKNEPVVLCLQDRHASDVAFLVMSRNPLFPGDVPLSREGRYSFFPWYRIATYSLGPNDHRVVSVWTGQEFKPLLKVHAVAPGQGDSAEHTNNAFFMSLSKIKPQRTFAAVKQVQVDGHTRFDVVVCPGADPALFICAAALDFVYQCFG